MRERRNDDFYFYCAFDICEKELRDFGVIGEINGKYYCDSICCERDLEQTTPKEHRTWQ
jgi:hypothetical protein